MGGNVDKAKGRMKQAMGDLTEDHELKQEGEHDEAAGKAKDAVDTVKDKADDAIDKLKNKLR